MQHLAGNLIPGLALELVRAEAQAFFQTALQRPHQPGDAKGHQAVFHLLADQVLNGALAVGQSAQLFVVQPQRNARQLTGLLKQFLGAALGHFVLIRVFQAAEEVIQSFHAFIPLGLQGLVGALQHALRRAGLVFLFGLQGASGDGNQGLAGGSRGQVFLAQRAAGVVQQQAQGVRGVADRVQAEGRLDLVQEGQQLPGAFFVLQRLGDASLEFGAQHVQNVFAQVGFGEHAVALGVNAFALGVEHIVIFQQVLAHIKIGAFHAFLRLFHDAAQQAHLDGHILVGEHALPQGFHLLAAEQAHEVVFQREVEARRAGVALTGGAPAQLVVNAAGFVPFRADDVQAAQLAHFFHIFHVNQELLDGFFIDAVLFGGQVLQQGAALGVGQVVGVGIAAGQHTVDVPQDFFGQLAAQLDIHTAAGHVGGDGDGPIRARAGDDDGFFIVLARVEHLVGDAGLQGLEQALGIGAAQAEDFRQPLEILRVFGIHAQVQAARHRPQIAHGQRVQLAVQRLQLRHRPGDHVSFIFVHPGLADEQHLGQAADHLGGEAFAEALGMFHRGGAHQLRAAPHVIGQHLLRDGAQLAFLGAVDHIGVILAPPEKGLFAFVFRTGVIGVAVVLLVLGFHRHQGGFGRHGLVIQVGGDGQDFQLVDLGEFFRFGEGRTGHTGQLVVHAEVVLQGDGGVGDVFRLHLDALFGLHGLVQPFGPAPPRHKTAGEFIHNHHLARLHQIILVFLVEELGAQGLFQIAQGAGLFGGDVFWPFGVAQGQAHDLFHVGLTHLGQ